MTSCTVSHGCRSFRLSGKQVRATNGLIASILQRILLGISRSAFQNFGRDKQVFLNQRFGLLEQVRIGNELIKGQQIPISSVQPMKERFPARIKNWEQTLFLRQLRNHCSAQILKPNGRGQVGELRFFKGKFEHPLVCFRPRRGNMNDKQKGDEFLH